MSHDVFVSYSSQDRAVAEEVCIALERRNIPCWMHPRDVPPGAHYAETVARAVLAARLMVVVFSQHANDSPQAASEIERAAGRGIPLVLFRIEDVAPRKTLESFLGAADRLDGFPPSRGRHFEKHLDRLLVAVGRLLYEPRPPHDRVVPSRPASPQRQI
jgi:hypothetical protein